MAESVYIHIPFCRQKCHYCSFVSFSDLSQKDEYIKTLKKEIFANYKGETLQTLYFGGGTPSLLSVDEIRELTELFNFSDNTEVTLEINPETVDEKYLTELKKTRINRLSIGTQTFDDRILENIGRKHKSMDVFNTVKNAQKVGFNNISLDFIYGLPEQGLESFAHDLRKGAELGVEHISLYGLKIDKGCYFYKNPPKNIADEDLQADMYLKAIEILEKYGFEHYEISNFAHRGKYSRHNVNYWKCGEYYGFGLGAHGYIGGIRYSNPTNLNDYFENFLHPVQKHELTKQEQLEEEIFLGLRLKKGINLTEINKKFNIDFEKKYANLLSKYLETSHFSIKNGILKFTQKGILISNYILADFLE